MNKRQLTTISLLLFIGSINLNAMNKETQYQFQEEKEEVLVVLLATLTPETEHIYGRYMSEKYFINRFFDIYFSIQKSTPSPNPITAKIPLCSYRYSKNSYYTEECLPAKHSLSTLLINK